MFYVFVFYVTTQNWILTIKNLDLVDWMIHHQTFGFNDCRLTFSNIEDETGKTGFVPCTVIREPQWGLNHDKHWDISLGLNHQKLGFHHQSTTRWWIPQPYSLSRSFLPVSLDPVSAKRSMVSNDDDMSFYWMRMDNGWWNTKLMHFNITRVTDMNNDEIESCFWRMGCSPILYHPQL